MDYAISAAPPLLIEAFRDEYGVAVEHGWGMTELSPVGTYNAPKVAQAGLSKNAAAAHMLKQGRVLPGIDMKILLEDSESGLLTALFRWRPGAELALHEHVEIEQTFVLEGSLVDDEGEVRAGNYVWRPKGNRHIARSPNGALVLSMFLKPNIFLAGEAAGRDLR